MIWFALNGAVVLIGLLAVVRMLGPVAGTRALLLSPPVLASDLTIDRHLAGWLFASDGIIARDDRDGASAQRRHVAGGALLAFVTVSKLFPGVLLVYLLVRRDWPCARLDERYDRYPGSDLHAGHGDLATVDSNEHS
jgi:hypothetical protein